MLSIRIVVLALALRESGGDPTKVNGKCVGILQIKPIMVIECNRIVGYEKYHLEDRFNPKLSTEMCELKLRHSLPKQWTIKDAALLWREGDKGRYIHADDHPKYVADVERYYKEIREGKIDCSFAK